MSDEWHEVLRGCGIHLHSYIFEKFGPANSLLLERTQNQCAILSPPPKPSKSLVESAISKGQVDALIISNLGHTSGYKDWLEFFPAANLFAPNDAIPLLKKLEPNDTFKPLLELDFRSSMTCIEAPGTRTGGTLLRSDMSSRPVAFLDEAIINLSRPVNSIFMRLALALTGSKTGLSRNNVFLKALTTDKKELLMAVQDIVRDAAVCIPAHGAPIRRPDQLRELLQLLQ